jgi:hypothetical protein
LIAVTVPLLERNVGWTHIGELVQSFGLLARVLGPSSIRPYVAMEPLIDKGSAKAVAISVIVSNLSENNDWHEAIPINKLVGLNVNGVYSVGVRHRYGCNENSWSTLWQYFLTFRRWSFCVNFPNIVSSQQMLMNIDVERWGLTDVVNRNINLNWQTLGRKNAVSEFATGNSNERPLVELKLLLDSIKRFGRLLARNDTGLRRLLNLGVLPDDFSELAAHYSQLPVIDHQSNYSYDSQDPIYNKLGTLYPSKLSRKFFGSLLIGIGTLLGIISNFSLGWSGWNHWRLWRRLTLGISGWVIAIVVVCHGAGLLLGIN